MITLRDFEVLVNTLELSPKDKEDFKIVFTPLFDFYSFIKEKKGISDEGVETLLLIEFEKRKNKFQKGLKKLGEDKTFVEDLIQNNLEIPSDKFAQCFVDVFEEIVDIYNYPKKEEVLKTIFIIGKFKFKTQIQEEFDRDNENSLNQFNPEKDNG